MKSFFGRKRKFRVLLQMNSKTAILNFAAGLTVGVGASYLGFIKKDLGKVVEEQTSTQLEFDRGLPKPISDVIKRNSYAVSFNKFTRNADWTIHKMNKFDPNHEKPDRQKSNFKEDRDLISNSDSIPLMWRTQITDFIKSGYDRGHLVPAANAWTQEDMDETFYLSNVSPQVGRGFNRGYWRRFEWYIRRVLTPLFDQVVVYTGPLYIPRLDSENSVTLTVKLIGNPPNIFVPTHFFKVILAKKESEYYHAAFVLPNEAIDHKKPLADFLTPIDVIERSSGFKFFDESKTKPLCSHVECAFPKLLKREASPDMPESDKVGSPSDHDDKQLVIPS